MKINFKLYYYIIFCILSGLFIAIIPSVIKSGFYYSFFGDEMFHANYVYLLSNGYRAFKDFFLYCSPLFHWLISPIFWIFGFKLETIYKVRMFMIIIFGFRLLFSFLFMRKLLNNIYAIIFILFTVLDPFHVFTAMQIRPDNLMFCLYFVGLYFLIKPTGNNNIFFSGLFFSLSVVTLIKIIPSVFIVLFFYTASYLYHKKLKEISKLILGFLIPILLFCMYFILQGSFPIMIQNLIFDPLKITTAIFNPTNYGYFYNPNNDVLYGLWGKPLNWYFIVYLIPICTFGGFLIYFFKYKKFKNNLIINSFIISGIINFILLYFQKNAFIQYYLTLNIYLMFMATIFIGFILNQKKFVNYLLSIGFVIILGLIINNSTEANNNRSNRRGKATIEQENQFMAKMPKDAKFFPNYIFHPLIYPIPYGFFLPEIPEYIRARYKKPLEYIKEYNIKYVFMSDYDKLFMGEDYVDYITQNYTFEKQHDLWTKKD
jgi:hypothetical protein